MDDEKVFDASEPSLFDPTLDDIRAEILHGPLAHQLLPFWNDVFEPFRECASDEENRRLGKPTKRELLASREGHIKPDAAFEIHRLLTTGKNSRVNTLHWEKFTMKMVQQAHDERGS